MKHKKRKQIVAMSLAVCIGFTSAPWERLQVHGTETEEIPDQSMGEEDAVEIVLNPDQVTAENEITEERGKNKTVYDLGGGVRMEEILCR